MVCCDRLLNGSSALNRREGSIPLLSVMNDQKLQKIIAEAKNAVKEYPCFDALAAAQKGSLWQTLTTQQKKKVEAALETCKSSS